MKKTLLIIIASITVIIFAFNGAAKIVKTVNTPVVSSRKTVVIDAGHGGKDRGTSGVDGTAEKVINLEIALSLRDYLMVSGINTVCVREGDYEIYPVGSDKNKSDLYNRLDFINSVDNAVMISIHQNHFSDEREHGAQIWYSANTAESKLYSDLILNRIKEFLQPDNKRKNKQSDSSYYILYKASVPSLMLECGFMSNREENEQLKNKEYQNNIAFCVLTGICGEV